MPQSRGYLENWISDQFCSRKIKNKGKKGKTVLEATLSNRLWALWSKRAWQIAIVLFYCKWRGMNNCLLTNFQVFNNGVLFGQIWIFIYIELTKWYYNHPPKITLDLSNIINVMFKIIELDITDIWHVHWCNVFI